MATNPHIYVSSVHGTNTGASDTSFAAQQTGAMTSLTAGNVYDNLGSAVAGASPGAGDTIYVADNHSATYDNGSSVASAGTIGGAMLRIISVDATAIDQYKPGATENLSDAAYDFTFSGAVSISGMDMETGDNVIVGTGGNATVFLQDGIVRPDATGDVGILSTADGNHFRLNNVDIATNNAAATCMTLSAGGLLIWDGGSVTTATTLHSGAAASGGNKIIINGVDLSPITTLISAYTTSTDVAFMKLTNCQLNASVTVPSTTELKLPCHRFEMYNCDDGTSDTYHRFYIADGCGIASNNDATYVTATESWYEGADKSSIEVQTTSLCEHGQPFVFELPAQYVDLGDTNKIVIDLVSNITLTNTDIAAFLVYPDATTAVTPRWVTSGKFVGAGNYGIDPLSAGTELETSPVDATLWTGEPASPKFYRITLDTSATPGQATAVAVRLELYKPDIDGTTNKLFINSEIGVL